MATLFYRINWKASTMEVALESGSGSAPATIGGYTSIGTFEHSASDADEGDTLAGSPDISENHVLWHHVRDALYAVGVQNMQAVNIYIDRLRSFSIGTGTLSVATDADAAAFTITPTPANAPPIYASDITFTTSDATKATVNAAGVVHGVEAGSAVITATLKSDNTKTATRNVTVT